MARRTSTTKSTTPEAEAEGTPEAEATSTTPEATSAEATSTTPEATSAEATSAEGADPHAAYRVAVSEAVEASDKSTGTLSAVSIDTLKRAMVAVKPSERVALMLATESEVNDKARQASPLDIGAILAMVAIRGAVEEVATSKIKSISDPLAELANAVSALNLSALRLMGTVSEADADRFTALRQANAESDTVSTLADKLTKVATSTKGTTASGADRADAIGTLSTLMREASIGDTFTVTQVHNLSGIGTGTIQHQMDNLNRQVAEAGGLATLVDNGRGRMVKGLKRVDEAEAVDAWETADKARRDAEAEARQAEAEADDTTPAERRYAAGVIGAKPSARQAEAEAKRKGTAA